MVTENSVGVNPMWGGHFDQGPDDAMAEINASIDFDKLLYAYDIRASIAHCDMLGKQHIITNDESTQIIAGLKQIKTEIEQEQFYFRADLEDIHMNIESRLHDIIGDVAGKLHTARSRNDQVATDFRLYVRNAIDELDRLLKGLQAALLNQAEAHFDTIMPGFTHLQTAQPVTFGHHLLAYVEMIGRDRSRFSDARKRLNESPLGAAALAGTSFSIDRNATAKSLEFDVPMRNSIDAVSDRDFALECLHSCAITSMHLSRLAEEIVLWMSSGFQFVSLSDRFTSGSSIMPQKRNPDAAELVRGKSGRIYAALFQLLTVMKGLPLTYSKDMQEDKEPVFDSVKQLSLSLVAMTGMVEDMKANPEAMKQALQSGHATATDLADWLVKNLGKPFRQCHAITGKIVRLAEAKNCQLWELSLTEMQEIDDGITNDIFDALSIDSAVSQRLSFGGTAPSLVQAAVNAARKSFIN